MPQIIPETFEQEPATAIIGLGHDCALTENLRRHFGVETAYPFDWWVTPKDAVAAVLRRPDPDWLYDPRLLVLDERHNSVRHSELGILLHHDFPREPGNGRVVSIWPEFILRAKDKTAFLLDRLFRLNAPGERILFIREGETHGENCNARQALGETFPLADWAFVLLEPTPLSPLHGWQGSPAIWDAILRDFAYPPALARQT